MPFSQYLCGFDAVFQLCQKWLKTGKINCVTYKLHTKKEAGEIPAIKNLFCNCDAASNNGHNLP